MVKKHIQSTTIYPHLTVEMNNVSLAMQQRTNKPRLSRRNNENACTNHISLRNKPIAPKYCTTWRTCCYDERNKY